MEVWFLTQAQRPRAQLKVGPVALDTGNSGPGFFEKGQVVSRILSRAVQKSGAAATFGHYSQRGGSILTMSLGFALLAVQDEAGTKSRWSLIPSV